MKDAFRLLAAAAAVTLALPRAALADEPTAEAWLEEGAKELAAKRYDKACAALRKSFRAEAVPSTLYRVAACEEEAGHVTSAAAAYDDYLALYDRLSPSDRRAERDRERAAAARRAALEALIPRVVFKLSSAPDGVRVTRRLSEDGAEVDVALGVPLPIDPGEHYVATEAPERARWEKRFFISKGERRTIELDVAPPDNARARRLSRPLAPVPNILPPLEPGPSGQRIAAYAVGGVGVAGLIVGCVTGAVAWGQKSTVEASCAGGLCNLEGQNAADKAKTLGAVSTATFVIGGVATAAGIILYVTEPGRPKLGAAPPRTRIGFEGAPGGARMVTQWTW
jgi:hypothetical protein